GSRNHHHMTRQSEFRNSLLERRTFKSNRTAAPSFCLSIRLHIAADQPNGYCFQGIEPDKQ
ncbi:hypothetical protein, partial [Mesorhizobium sp.]|uniref:hypothetical protein n=1 Tax=Mesorhizobium sp. TaxID=1871066 RepID=UPI00257D4613